MSTKSIYCLRRRGFEACTKMHIVVFVLPSCHFGIYVQKKIAYGAYVLYSSATRFFQPWTWNFDAAAICSTSASPSPTQSANVTGTKSANASANASTSKYGTDSFDTRSAVRPVPTVRPGSTARLGCTSPVRTVCARISTTTTLVCTNATRPTNPAVGASQITLEAKSPVRSLVFPRLPGSALGVPRPAPLCHAKRVCTRELGFMLAFSPSLGRLDR